MINLIGGGILTWYSFFKKWEVVSLSPIWLIFIVFSFFISYLFFFFLVLRFYHIKHLALQNSLHTINHFIRDKLIYYANQNKLKQSIQNFFSVFADQLCNQIKECFCLLTGDDSINCAIRIAVKPDENDKSSKPDYITIGRSSGLNQNRNKTSEPIHANEGVSRIFIEEKDSHGVLICHDIDQLASSGGYKKTYNDEHFSNDFKTFITAPINGLEENRKIMLGLLFITSKNDPFKIKHVDSLCAIADVIGIAFPQFIDLFKKRRKDEDNKNIRSF